jgi:hypothetical protein
VASCLRGALPPVDFLAVCFVRAIEMTEFGEMGLRGFFIVSREKREEILWVEKPGLWGGIYHVK